MSFLLRPIIAENINLLTCPFCKSDKELGRSQNSLFCSQCNRVYPITSSGQVNFLVDKNGNGVSKKSKVKDRLYSMKQWIKNFLGSDFFMLFHSLFTNTYPINIKSLINYSNTLISVSLNKKPLILNFGGGNFKYDNVINLDFDNLESVDLICDVNQLPFKSSSVDLGFSRALIEHLSIPANFVEEIYRVIKPSGITFHIYPLIYPIHGSPLDYWRFTPFGVKLLFYRFDKIKDISASGPFSLLSLTLSEIFITIFSLGNRLISDSISIPISILFSPIKWLDFFVMNHNRLFGNSINYISFFKKSSLL